MLDIAKVLRERLGEKASKVPTRKMPSLVIRLLATFNRQLKDLLPLLGKIRNATGAKAMRVLGWKPRSWQDAVTDTASSLIELGLVK